MKREIKASKGNSSPHPKGMGAFLPQPCKIFETFEQAKMEDWRTELRQRLLEASMLDKIHTSITVDTVLDLIIRNQNTIREVFSDKSLNPNIRFRNNRYSSFWSELGMDKEISIPQEKTEATEKNDVDVKVA
jgi:hypothetical protein